MNKTTCIPECDTLRYSLKPVADLEGGVRGAPPPPPP